MARTKGRHGLWDQFPQLIDRIDELQREVMRLVDVEVQARARGDRSHAAVCRWSAQALVPAINALRAELCLDPFEPW